MSMELFNISQAVLNYCVAIPFQATKTIILFSHSNDKVGLFYTLQTEL